MAPRVPAAHLDAWRALLTAHASVTGRAERELAQAGLPPLTWYDALWALYRAPRKRLRLSELADAATLSRPGLTRLVDRLESEGLVRREPAPDDRRGAFAVLTPAGGALLRRMWPVYARVLRDAFTALPQDDAEALSELLGKLSR